MYFIHCKEESMSTIINIAEVSTWQERLMEEGEANCEEAGMEDKFPIDMTINNKVGLFLGPAWAMECDGIVNSVDEQYDIAPKNSHAAEVHTRAGGDLIRAVLKQVTENGSTRGRTGEVLVTPGFDLPARHVLHIIGPRYHEKYVTASLNMLHTCYRACLVQCVTQKFRSLALTPIHSEAKGFTTALAVNMVLRTLRRYMEKFAAHFDKIILCFSKRDDYEVYASTMSLYFPRSASELSRARSLLPEDIGGEMGEVVTMERKIPISASPGEGVRALSTSPRPGMGPVIDLTQRSSAGHISSMRANPDTNDVSSPRSAAMEAFESVALLTRKLDVTMFFRIFYRSGCDEYGRIIYCGVGPFLTPDTDWELLKLHIVKLFYEMGTKQEFVFVYVDGNQGNHPPYSWMRQMFNLIPIVYRRTLRAVYIVKPSFWHWAFVSVAKPILSAKIWQRVFTVGSLAELGAYLPLSQVIIPEAVSTGL